MNAFYFYKTKIVTVFFLLFLISGSAFSKSPKNAEITKRIENMNTVIDLKITDEVTDQIENVIQKYRSDSEKILGRTSLYFPLIENALRASNLPDELKYIAVIESGLLPYAESHQGAAGIWQFMEGTALLFGLRIDKHIDERKDIVKSTEKALEYLKLLYDEYDNWTLALAAYNCGTGKLNKAIKKANGSGNYWEIQKHLPKETQKYIPRFIAASYLMNYYFMHDLTPSAPSDDLKYVASVKVFDKIEFKKLSKEFEIDLDIIKMLNPMFNKDFIPKSEKGLYYLTLPEQKMYSYIELYNSYENLLNKPLMAKVNEPANEEGIAETRTKMVVEYLSNEQNLNHVVRDNMKNLAYATNLDKTMSLDAEQNRIYKLKRKESLNDIALANNITLQDLMILNNIDETNGLNPGSFIKLRK